MSRIISQIKHSVKKGALYSIGIIVLSAMLFLTPVEMNTVRTVVHGSEPSVTASVPIAIHAQSAALIDVQSGRLMLSHHGDERMLIASLTKVMTAIVAIENGKLTDRVKVGKRAVGKEGSSLYLRLNEEMNLEHMLYGLMLRSGNDAATAIAEHVGGSEEGFAVLMNEKAQAIGMRNSNFVNPHGLNADNHYSTANDMALLTAYALKNPVFSDIVKTKIKKVPNPNEKWQYTWYNKNKMLAFYEGSDGVKTGYTKLAGRCLISSATRDGRQIAVVTLNDGNDWFDHTQWLNYGFSKFSHHVLIEKGDTINSLLPKDQTGEDRSTSRLPYVAGESFIYPLAEGEQSAITTEIVYTDPSSIHYKLGERGMLQFSLNNKKIGAIPFYDEGSPQLRIKHNSTFSFKVSEKIEVLEQHYVAMLKIVFKALVNG